MFSGSVYPKAAPPVRGEGLTHAGGYVLPLDLTTISGAGVPRETLRQWYRDGKITPCGTDPATRALLFDWDTVAPLCDEWLSKVREAIAA